MSGDVYSILRRRHPDFFKTLYKKNPFSQRNLRLIQNQDISCIFRFSLSWEFSKKKFFLQLNNLQNVEEDVLEIFDSRYDGNKKKIKKK